MQRENSYQPYNFLYTTINALNRQRNITFHIYRKRNSLTKCSLYDPTREYIREQQNRDFDLTRVEAGETVKYGLKSQGTRTRGRLRWQEPAAHTKDRSVLSSERAPHKKKTVTVTQVIKIWS
jgi:hypothetical protein